MSGKGKSIEIAQALRDKIRSGEIPSGVKFETIPKFAASYGTTVTTMSKVFDMLEEEGLLERINGLGVYVKQKAKRRFAVIFDSAAEHGLLSHKPIFMKYFIEHCRAENMEYTVFENVDGPEDCQKLQKQLKQNAFDVILIASRHFAKYNKKYLQNIPILAIGLYAYKWLDVCISFKYDWVVHAGNQLTEMGCDRIGLIALPADLKEWAAVEIGSSTDEYKKLIDRDGKRFSRKLLKYAQPSPRGGYECACELLRENPDAKKLGIINTDALLTHGVISAVLQSRNTLWEEICIVSHANAGSPMADFSIPVITYCADIKHEVDKAFELTDQYFATGRLPFGIHLLPSFYDENSMK